MKECSTCIDEKPLEDRKLRYQSRIICSCKESVPSCRQFYHNFHLLSRVFAGYGVRLGRAYVWKVN